MDTMIELPAMRRSAELQYLAYMLGGLGQELSGVSPVFGEKIEACLGIS